MNLPWALCALICTPPVVKSHPARSRSFISQQPLKARESPHLYTSAIFYGGFLLIPPVAPFFSFWSKMKNFDRFMSAKLHARSFIFPLYSRKFANDDDGGERKKKNSARRSFLNLKF